MNRLLATSTIEDCRFFLLLSITGHVSLFPLLFTSFENVTKVFLVLTYSLVSYALLSALFTDPKTKNKTSLLQFWVWERFYLYGLVVVALFECCLHSVIDPSGTMPFLPLLCMSVYCSLGILYVWILFVVASFK